MAYEFSRFPIWLLGGALFQSSTFSSITIDSAFVFETSGDAWFCRFTAPVTQSSGALTVHAYVSAVTGSPTDFRLEVRNGAQAAQDPDRPEASGSVLATSGAVDVSSAANTWVTFTISSVSLTQGLTYWLVIRNATGTPASNHASIIKEAASALWSAIWEFMESGFTTDGFSGDPSLETGMAACVIKFDDGTLFGNPYIKSETQTGANDRGNRIVLSENIRVSGAAFGEGSSVAGNLSGYEIWVGATNTLAVANSDRTVQMRTTNIRHDPITLQKDTSYDCVFTTAASDSFLRVFTMGEAEGSVPTDVLACRPHGDWSYVTGSTDPTVTPYTTDTSKLASIALVVDDVPAVIGADGGGKRVGLLQGSIGLL